MEVGPGSDRKRPTTATARVEKAPKGVATGSLTPAWSREPQPYSIRRYLTNDSRHEAIALAQVSTLESTLDIDNAKVIRVVEFLQRNGRDGIGK